MRTIYFHIGAEKTGTTSLQNFFHTNRAVLKDHGILYPISAGKKNHQKLALYCAPNTTKDLRGSNSLGSPKGYSDFVKNFPINFRNEIKDHPDYDVLVSNEHLSSRLKNKAAIEKLKELIPDGYQPKIILFVRRQDEVLISSYSTMIKSGSAIPFSFDLPINLDYLTIIEMWVEIFGKENVIIKPFESSQWNGNDIFTEFMNTIGRTDISDFQIPVKQSNKSLDRYQIQFLRILNKDPFFKKSSPNFRFAVLNLLESTASKEKISLSRQTKETILAKYVANNEIVAKKYVGNEDGILFKNAIEGPMEDVLPELTAEKSVELACRLLALNERQNLRVRKRLLEKLAVNK